MNRREVLLLLAGTAALPDQLFAIGRAVHKRVRAGTLSALNPHQNETVATIAELIIPKTDTAGGGEAGGGPVLPAPGARPGGDGQRQKVHAGRRHTGGERGRGGRGRHDRLAGPPPRPP